MDARAGLPVSARALLTVATPLALALMLTAASGTCADSRQKTAALGWVRLQGAEGCIGSGELARRVEALMGRAVFVSPARAARVIDGQVAPGRGHRWQVTVGVADGDGEPLGERTLHSDERSCRALDEPVALAIALMIDPDASLGPAKQPAAPIEQPPPAPRVVVRERPIYVPVPAPAPAEPTWRLAVRGGATLGFGLLPAAAAGAQAGVSIEPPWAPIGLQGAVVALLPARGSAGAVSGDFQAAFAAFGLCPLPGNALGPLLLSACLGIELGRLWADGQDGSGATWEQHQLVANVAAGARLAYRLWGPLAVSAGLRGAAMLVRDTFMAADAGGEPRPVFRPGPLVARPELSLELRFP